MRTIYLDYNATTPAALPVVQAMEPFLKEYFGNASSLHGAAREPRKALRDARRSLAALLGAADENSIVFTSGGTESNNAVLRSALASTGKRRIVTSSIEHSSILKPAEQLEKKGCEVVRLSVDASGQISMEELRRVLTPDTALVSLMSANNETGIFFPLEAAAQIIKERGVLLHVDAVQSIGKHPLDLKKSQIDYLSLSGHKFYGPKGVGALYIKPGAAFEPLITGGSQERGRRGGTENIPGIAGLGKASELVAQDLTEEIERLKGLRLRFEEQITTECAGVDIAGRNAARLPNTTLALFQGVDAEALLFALDGEGVACSSGSACMSGARDPSHVLTAMGYDRGTALSAIRFSFGRFTQPEELEETAVILKQVLQRLRALPGKAAAGS